MAWTWYLDLYCLLSIRASTSPTVSPSVSLKAIEATCTFHMSDPLLLSSHRQFEAPLCWPCAIVALLITIYTRRLWQESHTTWGCPDTHRNLASRKQPQCIDNPKGPMQEASGCYSYPQRKGWPSSICITLNVRTERSCRGRGGWLGWELGRDDQKGDSEHIAVSVESWVGDWESVEDKVADKICEAYHI